MGPLSYQQAIAIEERIRSGLTDPEDADYVVGPYTYAKMTDEDEIHRVVIWALNQTEDGDSVRDIANLTTMAVLMYLYKVAKDPRAKGDG